MAWDWSDELPAEVGWNLRVPIAHRPGALAQLGEALVQSAKIKVEGGCGVVIGDDAHVHLLVMDEPNEARSAVELAGFRVADERQVLVLYVHDQPGDIIGWAIAGRLADEGINIDLFYVATRARLIFGVDDLEKAQRVLT